MRQVLAAAALAAGLFVAAPAAHACPMVADTARDSGTLDEAGATALPVELVRAPDGPDEPFRRASDYGRLLILLSVPAAFVGLQVHRARRVTPLPPR